MAEGVGRPGQDSSGDRALCAKSVWGSMGVTFPTGQPAVIEAVTVRGHNAASAPSLDTEFARSIDRKATDKESPIGLML